MKPSSSNEKPEKTLLDKVQKILDQDSTIPVFSTTALKLLQLSDEEDLEMGTLADVVKLDPGLTTKYLKLANSVVFGGKSISNIQDALFRIGMKEVRNLAMTIGVMDVLSIFQRSSSDSGSSTQIEIEWEMFWLHSLLTGRLTECIAEAYRPTTGKEYLAGLLHDVGKIFLQRYFPKEFESAVAHAMEKGCGMFEAEQELFYTTHAEVGWNLCKKWCLHREIERAIRFHHEPNSPSPDNKDPVDPENEHLLATCICVADALANMCKANIQGTRSIEMIDSLPEWKLLQNYSIMEEIELDVEAELQKAQESIAILCLDEENGVI